MNIDDVISPASETAPDEYINQAIKLWECLAFELSYVIGVGGFQSLFLKSITTSNIRFPCLKPFRFTDDGDLTFECLRKCFEGCGVAEVREANESILKTHIETLSSILGKSLTTSILQPVWNKGTTRMMVQGGRVDEVGGPRRP